MNGISPPKRIAKRPPRVAANWHDVDALDALLTAPDVTPEEVRAISRHHDPLLMTAIAVWCSTVPLDVIVWLSEHRPAFTGLLATRNDLPLDLLISLIEKVESTRIRILMIDRLRERTAAEGVTREQVATILASQHQAMRDEGFRLVGTLK